MSPAWHRAQPAVHSAQVIERKNAEKLADRVTENRFIMFRGGQERKKQGTADRR